MNKAKYSQAIVVEGRDDVDAVQRAADALIIPTHGFGITAETWDVISKAYEEKGLIVLTDPDFSGEEIRRKITERFPDAINAYIDREDAESAGDIGVENAKPEVIAQALHKAMKNFEHEEAAPEVGTVGMSELVALGLVGAQGSAEKRARLCKELGIGYANSKTLLNKLAKWKIGIKELEQAIEKIEK